MIRLPLWGVLIGLQLAYSLGWINWFGPIQTSITSLAVSTSSVGMLSASLLFQSFFFVLYWGLFLMLLQVTLIDFNGRIFEVLLDRPVPIQERVRISLNHGFDKFRKHMKKGKKSLVFVGDTIVNNMHYLAQSAM